GGERAVRRIVAEFVAAAAADAKVDLTRRRKFPEGTLESEFLYLVSGLSDGPFTYQTGSTKALYKGMGMTDEQFSGAAGHLKAALEKNGVKAEDVQAVLQGLEGMRKDLVDPAPQNPGAGKAGGSKGRATPAARERSSVLYSRRSMPASRA